MTSWYGMVGGCGGVGGGAWLENVQMAGRNGGVLIACLQIGPVVSLQPQQSGAPEYRGTRLTLGLPGLRGPDQLITETLRGGNVSTRVVCVDTGVRLCCQQIIYVSLSESRL